VAELAILLLGDTDRPEFAQARRTLQRLARVIPAADVDAACDVLARPGPFETGCESRRDSPEADGPVAVDAIVVAQAYPGEFSADALDRLTRLAPLARVVGLLGSWCEGEVRSGRPWPGAVRVYWHQWRPRCHQELGRIAQGLLSSWCLPPTATDEERLLASANRPLSRREGLIVIWSPSFDMADWLSQACRRAGYATVQMRNRVAGGLDRRGATVNGPDDGVCAALFDALDCRGEELDDLRQLAAALRPAPVIVLMSFPRVDDRDRVLAAGAAAILSKPLTLEELDWQVENCRLRIEN
jgi:hypothetical protein